VLKQGLVVLSQNDADAPDLPAVGTVSKDDAWDDGGRAIGAEAAGRGACWVDRPYFTGTPEAAWLLDKIDAALAGGAAAVQVGNELNLPLEGWTGGKPAYDALYAELRAARPGAVLLYQPPSPGVQDWEDWVDLFQPAYAVHCYGSCAQMVAVVDWYLAATTGVLHVTECNPGAGQSFDLDAWARTELVAFLDWCATQPRVASVLYFAWRWDASGSLPSSVDAAGSAVPGVLAEWRPPANGGADDAWYPPAVRRPISRNYTPGRGGHPVRAVVEHIAEGLGSPFGWFDQDRGDQGSSAHFWVSATGVVEQYRPLSDTCWANGPVCAPDLANPSVAAIVASGVDPNQVTVACEHEGYSGDALTAAQTAASRELTAWLCARFALAVAPDQVIGHGQLDACDRPFCPGPAFPWEEILGAAAPGGFDVAAARDQLWTIAGQCEAGGYPWLGQAVKSAVALSKGDA